MKKTRKIEPGSTALSASKVERDLIYSSVLNAYSKSSDLSGAEQWLQTRQVGIQRTNAAENGNVGD